MIQLNCPGCNATLKVSDDKAGKAGKCPKCGTRVSVPASSPVAAPLTTVTAAPEAEPVAPKRGPRPANDAAPRMPNPVAAVETRHGARKIAIALGVVVAGVLLIGGSISVLVIASSTPDIRFMLVNGDGSISGFPDDFLLAIDPGLHLTANPEPGKPPAELLSNPEATVLCVLAADSDTRTLLSATSVLCRVYWKSSPQMPKVTLAHTIRCESGKLIPASLGRRLFSLQGLTIDEQYFVVPRTERPVSFLAEGATVPLKSRTLAQSKEEGEWGREFIYDKAKTQRWDSN
jgi:DNA-directed RNA polymerase subunit RPC12/RpoP